MGCCMSNDDDGNYEAPPQRAGPPPMRVEEPKHTQLPKKVPKNDVVKANTVATVTSIRKDSMELSVQGDTVRVSIIVDSCEDGAVLKVYKRCVESAAPGGMGVTFNPQPGCDAALHDTVRLPNAFGYQHTCTVFISPEQMVSDTSTGKYPIVFGLERGNSSEVVLSYVVCESVGATPTLSRHVLCKGGNMYLLKKVYGADDNDDCVVCLSVRPNAVVMPCRHQCVCKTCAEELKKRDGASCPLCRTAIEKIIF